MTSEEIRKQLAKQQVNAQKAASVTPAAPDLQSKVNDHSDYINEMHRAQQEAAQASLEAAYKQNVAAIDRAGVGVDKTYQDAKNQAAGTSEQAKRNFAQYATANGLNNGTAGQAELARSVTLQKALGELDKQKAQTVADLELQRTNAETEYNSAIAKAKAEGDYQLAQALYQEKVRVEDSLANALQQEYQNALNKYSMDYQVGRDTVNDLIKQYQLAYQQEQDALAQENYLKEFAYQQQRDAVADSQWQSEFNLTQQKYLQALAQAQNNTSAAPVETPATPVETPAAPVTPVTLVQTPVLDHLEKNLPGLATQSYATVANDPSMQTLLSGASKTGLSELGFETMSNTLKNRLDAGHNDLAVSMLDRRWNELSVNQRAAVQNLLRNYELEYRIGG